jgi:hypothetical protein
MLKGIINKFLESRVNQALGRIARADIPKEAYNPSNTGQPFFDAYQPSVDTAILGGINGYPEVTIGPQQYASGVRYTLPGEPSADPSRDLIVHRCRLERIVLPARPEALLAN